MAGRGSGVKPHRSRYACRRGKHNAIIAGYDEDTPLDPEEWALLTPVWWPRLIEGACVDLALGIRDHRWTIGHLLRRSPLMGADAAPDPG